MSDFMIRNLAAACAPRIAARVEAVVLQTVREALPDVIQDVLREQYPGEQLRLYVAKRSAASRRERDALIRAEFTGRNGPALSARFGLSQKQIFRIARTFSP